MHTLPLLSVIVPVYRVEAYLDHCIASLCQQTYTNLEILLVDDGSPDGSGAICDRWAQKDSRIRVIHQLNGGAGKARNTALDQAHGELIAMADSDDYLEKHMYAHLFSLLDENTDIAECEARITEDETCVLDDGTQAQLFRCDREQAMNLHLQEKRFTQTIWNKLYRRSAIAELRFPEGNLIDDEFFTYRAIGNARNLVHSTAAMYAYRQQDSSVMHRPYSLKRLQGIAAHQQRLAYLQEEMPSQVYQAKVCLFFACIYALQMSLLWLKGDDLKEARAWIHQAAREITPLRISRQNSLSTNLWLILGQISLEGVCHLQNFLESGDRRKEENHGI